MDTHLDDELEDREDREDEEEGAMSERAARPVEDDGDERDVEVEAGEPPAVSRKVRRRSRRKLFLALLSKRGLSISAS